MNKSRAAVGVLGVALVFAGLVWEPRAAAGAGGGGAGGGGGGTGGGMHSGDISVTAPTRPDNVKRDAQHLPDWISYADCTANITLTFNVNNAAPATKTVVGYWGRGDDSTDCR